MAVCNTDTLWVGLRQDAGTTMTEDMPVLDHDPLAIHPAAVYNWLLFTAGRRATDALQSAVFQTLPI